MSKLILNVSNKTYTTEEVEKLLEREQELRESKRRIYGYPKRKVEKPERFKINGNN